MKKQYIIPILGLLLAIALGVHFLSINTEEPAEHAFEKMDKKDRIDLAIEQEFEMTKDPATGEVPRNRLHRAMEVADELRANAANRSLISNLNWEERGPNNVGGRTRAILVDANDDTGNTIWAGSAGGGLWKSTDAGINWTPVNDFFDNLAVTTIAQHPATNNTMYFGTGEGFFNADAIRGLGIWKSIDGGTTWDLLSTTANNSSFRYVQKIVINDDGTVFAATRDGVQRSEDGGATWSKALGSGVNGASTNSAGDIEMASDGDLYAAMGLLRSTDGIYKSTDDGDSWTKLDNDNNGLPESNYERIELACAPNNSEVVYALFQNKTTRKCLGIYRTGDGGDTWVSKVVPPVYNNDNFTSKQAWYDLICAVDPNNANRVFIGGLDLLLSNDGGDSWTQISQWYGANGIQEVHADQHAIVFETGSSDNIWFGNDGGVYRTTNGSAAMPNIVSRKNGYNVTQYYAADLIQIADSTSFIAGAQDNGTQRYLSSGINSTTEVTGGDGAFSHIDADEPDIQISAYTYNNYRVTTDAWENYTKYNVGGNRKGRFINPTDYDSKANILYGSFDGGKYSYLSNIGNDASSPEDGNRSISEFGGAKVSSVTVSPNENDRVYFGLDNGDVVRVDNANSSSASGTLIRSGSNYVSSIAIAEGNENHIIVTYSNYGVVSVWSTTDGGTNWTDIEGNLPDIPIRSVIFHPNDDTQVLLGTELGVWTTDEVDGSDTEWVPNNTGFANARVDMLAARKSDNTVIAATHGRGLFSAVLPGEIGGAPECSATVSSFPYEESFESSFGNWVQNGEDDIDWTRQSGGTASSGTGPSAAEDGTFYAYVEVSDPNFPDKDAILESPCFDLTGLDNPVLNFSYHMKGANLGRLEVDASFEGVTWIPLTTLDESRDSWQNTSINLREFKDGEAFRLRFWATSGDSWDGDICIDHIQIFDTPAPGECNTLTLSILTDNYAKEVGWEVKQGGMVIDSRDPGFYTLNAHQYEEEICLPSGCYELVMIDKHGDGLCCGYGQGNYSLTDENGMELASGADYDHNDVTTFCVEAQADCPAINFNDGTISSFTTFQDSENSIVEIQDGGSTLFVSNNGWKAFSYNYSITSNTYLRFDFRSTQEGEIHAIGFNDSNNDRGSYSFQLHGYQTGGANQQYNNYSGTDWKTYTIPVGSFYTGNFNRIYFISDNDANQSLGNSFFRNVRVYDGDCLMGAPEEELSLAGSGYQPTIEINVTDTDGLVQAFPNPFQDELQVVLPKQVGNAEVRLIDMRGQVLQVVQQAQGSVFLGQNVNLIPGMYFVQVRAKDFEQSLRVVHIKQ
jgi:photosystem II stability/assembly factor-like uncharacterized protein